MIDPRLAGRIGFRHRAPTEAPLPPGLHKTGLFEERDYLLFVPGNINFVPGNINATKPSAFMCFFHGGGGSAEKVLPIIRAHAETHGILALIPQSLFHTWDIVIGGNGPDRERLERALDWVAARFALRPDKFAFMGRSDGGSYALSNGIANGDFVTHIVSFSAGFLTPLHQEGAPYIFISHGTRDEEIAIEKGRGHAEQLKAADYDVCYFEYEGPHASNPDVVDIGFQYFLKYPGA
jgi:hypothetical protein